MEIVKEQSSVIAYMYNWSSAFCITVLEIKKNSRLSLCQMPGDQTPDFGCPHENLVVRQGFP